MAFQSDNTHLALEQSCKLALLCEAFSGMVLDLGIGAGQVAAFCVQLGAMHALAVDAGSEITSPATDFVKLTRIRST